MTDRFTSRTGQATFQRCPRAGLLSQHFDGVGRVAAGKPFEMTTGIYVHIGIAGMLEGLSVDAAVNGALEQYDEEVKEGQLIVYKCRFEQVREEQRALIEGVLRAWAFKRLPYFQEEYEIVEVEKDRYQLLCQSEGENIWQEFRLDALLKHKETGLYSILSNKTTGAMDERKIADAKTDLQGLSEIWGIEQALGIKVHGVFMEYLLTGRKELEETKDGWMWTQWSPLVRGWYNPMMDESRQFAWRYDWEEQQEGEMWPKKHRLPKGYTRIRAADVDGGVKAWVGSLAKGEMFPGADLGYLDPLASQFVSIEYYRNNEDLRDWLEQTQEQEKRIGKGLRVLSEVEHSEVLTRSALNKWFPQFRHSCQYPSACQFLKICWEGEDPMSSRYQWRVPHHEKERERVEKLAK